MAIDFQIIVIGGGPAGARSAELLAAAGFSVALFEAGGEEHEVLCSGLLNAEARIALGESLPDQIRARPFQPQLELVDTDNQMRCYFDPGYVNMSRPLFDRWLRNRAGVAGARLFAHAAVRRIRPFNGGIAVDTPKGQFTARLIVDATGWKSISRKHCRVSPAPQVHAFQGLCRISCPEGMMQAIYISKVTPFYGWVVPKGDSTYLLGAGFKKSADATRDQKANPWAKLEPFIDSLEQFGYQVDLIDAKPAGHPITCINSLGQLWEGRSGLFPVGEAAGMVSPSSGDGISYCLQGANALAKVFASLDFNELKYDSDGLDQKIHSMVARRISHELSAARAELRFNIAKAWVAAHPTARRQMVPLLPLFLRRKVHYLRYAG